MSRYSVRDMSAASQITDITSDEVRKHLLTRARSFGAEFGLSLSAIGDGAIRDSKFLANVERGENFTIKTYQRVLDWIDAERALRRAGAGAGQTPSQPPKQGAAA